MALNACACPEPTVEQTPQLYQIRRVIEEWTHIATEIGTFSLAVASALTGIEGGRDNRLSKKPEAGKILTSPVRFSRSTG
jgi:hypothetical protein